MESQRNYNLESFTNLLSLEVEYLFTNQSGLISVINFFQYYILIHGEIIGFIFHLPADF